jgi:hypothetical protein
MTSPRSLTLVGQLSLTLVLAIALYGGRPASAAAVPPLPDTAPLLAALVEAANGVVLVPGPPVSLPVQARSVSKLGAATVLITYDPSILKATTCQRNTAFDVGLCNTAHDSNADGIADAVLFNVVSLQGVTASDTPIMLVNISWEAAAGVQAPAATDLRVEVQTFTDTNGSPMAVTAQDGQITLKAGPTPVPMRHVYLPLVVR